MVTLWNNGTKTSLTWASNLQHFCECRSAAWEPCSKSHVIPIWGNQLMFNSRSRKNLLGALILGGLLSWSWTAVGQAQDSARKVLKKVPVAYPSLLKSKGIGGVVRLKVFVKPDGTVRDSEVLGGNPILAESAQKSVMQWKFSAGSSETALELSVTFDPRDSGS